MPVFIYYSLVLKILTYEIRFMKYTIAYSFIVSIRYFMMLLITKNEKCAISFYLFDSESQVLNPMVEQCPWAFAAEVLKSAVLSLDWPSVKVWLQAVSLLYYKTLACKS